MCPPRLEHKNYAVLLGGKSLENYDKCIKLDGPSKIKALNNVDDLVTGDEIFFGIKNDIQLNADQTPLYDHIKNVGSKYEGDFIFVKRNGG